MSAVATKPRAKAKKETRQEVGDWRQHARTQINQIVDMLYTLVEKPKPGPAQDLIEMAESSLYDVRGAEDKDPVWAESTTIWVKVLDAKRMLHAVSFIQEYTETEGSLQLAVVGALLPMLDSLEERLRALPESPVAQPQGKDTTEADFMKGKALVCALMRTSDLYVDGDASSLISNYRENTDTIYMPQANYAEPILRELIDNPALLDGFSGALSQALAEVDFEGSEEIMATASYKACRMLNPYSEEVDTNYTAPSLNEQLIALGMPITDQLPPKAQRQAVAAAGESAPWNDDEMHEVWDTLTEVISIMRLRSEEANCNHMFSALYVLEKAEEVLSLGLNSKHFRDCENALAPLGIALSVLNVTLGHFDDLALRGAWRLLELARQRLDAEVDRCIAEFSSEVPA